MVTMKVIKNSIVKGVKLEVIIVFSKLADRASKIGR